MQGSEGAKVMTMMQYSEGAKVMRMMQCSEGEKAMRRKQYSEDAKVMRMIQGNEGVKAMIIIEFSEGNKVMRMMQNSEGANVIRMMRCSEGANVIRMMRCSEGANVIRMMRCSEGANVIRMMRGFPPVSFPELLENDWALLAFPQQLEVMGLVLISQTPAQTKQCHLLSQRVAYCSRTYYGETFKVHNKTDPNNLAYTQYSLGLHTDLPCLSYKPGVQLLHCISQIEGDGGDNLFVDSFQAAAIFRSLHPDRFNLLVKTPVVFSDTGVEDGQKFHIANQTSVICLDEAGNIATVNMNNICRDFINLAPADVFGWYEALYVFSNILNHPQNVISYKLKPGMSITTFVFGTLISIL
nr:gamma-butyrobetaine dioxygenase-like [Cherax quadricarinatus]